MSFQKGHVPHNKRRFYNFEEGQKNYCRYCGIEIPLLTEHYELRQFCAGHENKLKNPAWIDNSGSKHYRWNGGRRLHHKHRIPYWEVLKKGHPRANKDGYVSEHVLIAEEKIGRPLTKKEVVHHIDGNSLNNDPNNLQVLSGQSEHAKIHKFLSREKGIMDFYPSLN